MADILGGLAKDFGAAVYDVGNASAGLIGAKPGAYQGFVNPFTYNPGGTPTSSGGGSTSSSAPGGMTNYAALSAQLTAALNNQYYGMSQMRPGQIIGGAMNTANQAWNSAYAAAQQQGNQWYNAMINQLQSDVGAEEDAQRNLAQNSLTGIQENLSNVLQQNQITGQRTQQDTATTLSNMANAQQNQLAQTGLQSDTATRQMQSQQGVSGTVESGLGQGQQQIAQQGAQLQSQQEQQGFNIQQAAQNLFQNRTMEDLARGSDIAQQQADLQSQATNFSLQSYISQMTAQTNQTAEGYYSASQQMINAAAGQNYDTAINKYLAGIQGSVAPQDYATTASALLGAYK